MFAIVLTLVIRAIINNLTPAFLALCTGGLFIKDLKLPSSKSPQSLMR